MQGRHSLSVPVVGPNERPGRNYGHYGERVYETEHLSVPRLARHLVDQLPREFTELWFSATVYRYRLAAPWIVDVEVFGLSDTDLEDHTFADTLMGQVTDLLDSYNWQQSGDSRFAGPNVVLLREFEQGQRKAGRVSVRRYYLTRKPRGWWEKVRSLATGWLR